MSPVDTARYVFAVPLKAKQNCEDWSATLALLRETLLSILAQSCPDFLVLVACQDEPDVIAELGDPRLQWVHVDREPPAAKDFTGATSDKRAKICLIGLRLRERGFDDFYVTYLDADDLVISDLVATVLKADNKAGFIFQTGFVFDFARNRLSLMSDRFEKDCGSSAVCYMRQPDLPTAIDDYKSYFVNMHRHAYTEELAQLSARPLMKYPTPAAVYRINHAESLERMRHGSLKTGRGKTVDPIVASQTLGGDFSWPAGSECAATGVRKLPSDVELS